MNTKSIKSIISDYYELTKPNVWWLLVFTAIGAMIRAGGNYSNTNELFIPSEIIILVILSVTFGTAGAEAISNYIDKDVDALMQRTKNRPIPSGRIKAINSLIFGIILSSLAIIFSYMIDYSNNSTLPIVTFLMIFGLFDYLIVYSAYLKRKNLSNIILGGFSGAVPALIGYTAISKTIVLEGLLISALVFIWIPAHIWSLSLRFQDDYSKAKIPMLPTVVSLKTSIRLIALSSIILVIFSLMLYQIGTIYFITAIITGIIVLFSSLKLLLEPTKERSWKLFKISSPYLAVLFLAMIIDVLIN
jgi:protoheme IX farnesyltransferase|tara:strand:+ start:109 stop:1017 length:909 start_codon:yes stop_codon:yes gene_type:complete